MGGQSDLVYNGTIEEVTKHFPRKNRSTCFASTIREENALKPCAHMTALGKENFPNGVHRLTCSRGEPSGSRILYHLSGILKKNCRKKAVTTIKTGGLVE